MKKIFGFTLAEVLITLGIIGVIAALTIPILMKHYQQQAVLSQLKKAYSEFNQALKMAEVDYGSPEQWKAILLNCEDASQCFYDDFLKPHLKIAEFCESGSIDNCWDTNAKALNNTANIFSASHLSMGPAFVTASGYSIFFWVSGSRNSSSIHIDVNGPKQGPNILGKDIFAYGLYFVKNPTAARASEGLYPQGYVNFENLTRYKLLDKSLSTGACSKERAGSSAGLYCSGLIMLDGWKFASDYPW